MEVLKSPATKGQIKAFGLHKVTFVQRYHPIAKMSPKAIKFIKMKMALWSPDIGVHRLGIVLTVEKTNVDKFGELFF